MKGYTNAVIAALVAGAVAQVQYAPMPTRPAVLAKREPTCVMDSCQEGKLQFYTNPANIELMRHECTILI
jgi:hypothetical protein